MIAPIAAVAAALLAQPIPAPAVAAPPEPPTVAPASPEAPASPLAPPAAPAQLRPGELCLEVGGAGAPRASAGDLDLVLNAGAEWVPLRLGPFRGGVRAGVLLAGATGVCSDDRVECDLGGAYLGAVVRLAPLDDRAVSPWVAVSATAFYATGFESEDTGFGAFEPSRLSAGVDVLVPPWRSRLGVFAFRTETSFRGTPPPLADGHVTLWGGGLRLELGVELAPRPR